MPAKQKKGRGRGRVAGTPDPQPTESVHAPAASDDESSGASTVSETVGTKKKKITVEREKQYPWKNAHQDVLAEFWLNHPIFYDKTQEHYKNREMKFQLLNDLIEQHRDEWEKLYTPLPSVSQVDAHLRNTRTRFVKLLKRKSGAPAVVLSYTDQKILDRYMFLRPHIQRNKTRATHTFAHVQFGGDADDDEGDDDDIDDNHSQEGVEPQPDTSGTQDGSQQTSTSLAPSKGKGKCKNKRPCPSPIPDSPDLSEIQILQQAQNLISNIRVPTKSDHERRVRDFSRYMEDEMPRIPESSWDECSFTIMNVIRGFKSAHQHGQPTISQAPAYQQNSGSQYPEQQRGYLTRQFGTVQQPNTIQQLGTFNQPSSFLPLSTYHSPSTYQQPSAYQQPSTCQQPSTLQQFGSIQQQTCSLQQSQPEPGTGLVWFLRALRPRNS